MTGDEKVIEYLNKALRAELTAINQFWLHYRLQEDWGFAKLAKKSREESIEEMQHADKIMDRIIFLEGHPNLQHLDPLRIGENVKQCLEGDLAAEHEAQALYKEAAIYCRKIGDLPTANIFEELMTDEEGHIDFLETQLDLMGTIGEQNYGMLNAVSADAAEG